jgi:hypothetical protein
MANKFSISVFALACGVIFAGCGGGSGLKDNELLGALPRIYADYKLADKADDEKMDKLVEKGDFVGAMKEEAKQKKEGKERREKYQADLKAELAKIAGKDVPFTVSEAFKQLKAEVTSVKFGEGSYGSVTAVVPIVAKEDFKIDKENKGEDYSSIYYKVLAKDGSAIGKGSIYLSIGWLPKFTQGQSLQSDGKDPMAYFNISGNPEKWVDFASIEFVTKSEFDGLKDVAY